MNDNDKPFVHFMVTMNNYRCRVKSFRSMPWQMIILRWEPGDVFHNTQNILEQNYHVKRL